ncbi:MAG: diaminopimelate decarboxylase [Candidatus Palauibacterales bacterium]|nr:diaminopimelate decarboxylase [Candidatus Palauibacterales bacterium]
MSGREAGTREAGNGAEPGAAAASHAAGIAPEVLEEVAAEIGTPAYVYDGRALDAGVRRWTEAVPPEDILYSVKANSNLSVLRRLASHGIGLEAGTWGEYARARRSGVPSDRVTLGGVPKDETTVRSVLKAGVGLAVFQAEGEVEAAARHADPGRPTPAGVRVLPGIRAGAHPSLETGAADAKFGFAPDEVPAVWRRLAETPGLEPTTLAVHLGSGLDDAAPYVTALDLLLDVAGELGGHGPAVRALDVGGGLGVDYEAGDAEGDPDPGELARRLRRRMEERAGEEAPRLRFEPGRSVCARAGVVLTRVQYGRERGGRPALVCDAGYSDFPRHVLYGAHHDIGPIRGEGRGPADVAVLGPTCESGDVLGVGRSLHGVEADDLLVVRDAGAYGFVMASNYNSRPRPPEVLVDGDDWRPIRDRESLDDLWRGETKHLLDD